MLKTILATALTTAALASAALASAAAPPTIVATSPADAGRGLIRISKTEIRHYAGMGKTAYLRSTDNGLTWKSDPTPKGWPAAACSTLTKEAPSIHRLPNSKEFLLVPSYKKPPLVSTGGIDGTWAVAGTPNLAGIRHHILPIRGGKRILVPSHVGGVWTWWSDDNGKTWNQSNKVQVPAHKPGGIHKGTRWNHGAAEPTVVELKDGRLWMLIRCAQDQHWETFSKDGGETWSKPRASRFWGTITMPNFYRLSDGRLLLSWSNTTPLAELATATGRGEDVFTNRIAQHLAISEDDGKTWAGFREVLLDPNRNSTIYALGGSGNDRGVQQSEIVQLDDNRILMSIGQNSLSRRLVIVDLRWLVETGRTWTATDGLDSWTSFHYIDRILGHCQYCRMPAGIIQTVAGNRALVLSRIDEKQAIDTWLGMLKMDHYSTWKRAFGRSKPPRVVDPRDGATWNFPAAHSGSVTMEFMLPKGSQGATLYLADRWFNPEDRHIGKFAFASIPLTPKTIKPGKLHTLTIRWAISSAKTRRTVCTAQLESGQIIHLDMPTANIPQNGVGYVMIRSAAKTKSKADIAILSIEAKKAK